MNKNNFLKNQENIISLIEKFNVSNEKLLRYFIFNTFQLSYVIEEHIIYVDINFVDNLTALNNTDTTIGAEMSFKIKLDDDKDTLWYIKLLEKYTKNTLQQIETAKQFTKPQIGILMYDEFTGNYYLNPSTGPILLKNKEIQRKMSSTKFEMMYFFKEIRAVLTNSENYVMRYLGVDVIPIDTLEEISIKNKSKIEKLKKIEMMARNEIHIEIIDKNVSVKVLTTNKFDSIFQKPSKEIITYSSTFKIDDQQKIEQAFNKLNFVLDLNDTLLKISQKLISKKEPILFELKKDKYFCTQDGQKLLEELDLIDLLNGTF